MRDLNAVLAGPGVVVGSFRLMAATGVSADGRAIAGSGVIPSTRGVPELAGRMVWARGRRPDRRGCRRFPR